MLESCLQEPSTRIYGTDGKNREVFHPSRPVNGFQARLYLFEKPMDIDKRLAKNARIKATRALTKQRRKTKDCKVYSCKIDKSHLSDFSLSFLKNIFLEAKWFCNDVIRSGIFDYDYKTKTVAVMNRDREWEVRLLRVLSSQIRQSLVERIKGDVINLSKLKKATGRRVGRLRFRKVVRTLPLNQFGSVFRIMNSKYAQVQGCRKSLRIRGLSQLPKDAEVARAELVNTCGDYYLKVTCFVDKEVHIKMGKKVGLDFGIETTVTTSAGEKFNIKVPETKRIKKLRRGFHMRTKKGSRNRWNRNEKIKKELERIDNRKRDQKNKLVRYLVDKYDVIVCQDENLSGWKQRFGAGVQMSCMKGIISDLKNKSETFIQVDKWFPSTRTCDVCGNVREVVPLLERTYHCSVCGNDTDRDTHSALNILQEGLGTKFPRLIRNVEDVKSPVELTTSICVAVQNTDKLLTEKREALAFRHG